LNEADALKLQIDGTSGGGGTRDKRLSDATEDLNRRDGRRVPPDDIDGAPRARDRALRGPAPVFEDSNGREICCLRNDESLASRAEHNLPDGIRADELS